MSKKKRPFSIDDLWALARIGSPTISPDGHLACVSVTRYEMGENNSTTNLWLLSTDGKTRRQLTRGKNDGEPQFSPDGKSIAFVAKRHADDLKDQIEASHLYVIDLNGGEARRLTSIDTGVFGIRWLPDGKHIAFMSYSWPDGKTEAEQNMRAAKEKSNKVKAVISERNHYRYWDHWLPEGRRVHVWRVPASGGKAKDLLAGDRSWLPATEPNAGMYDFSPNGRSMAFVQEREADPKAPIYSDIVLLDLRTGDIKNLTAGSDLTHEHPRFSPNGRQIACLTTDVGKAYNEQSRLALIDPVKASVRVLTGDWDFGVNAPIEWRADGNALVFSAEQREIQPLFEMLIDGSAPREISRGPGHGGSTGPAVLSKNGNTMVYMRAANRLSAVCVGEQNRWQWRTQHRSFQSRPALGTRGRIERIGHHQGLRARAGADVDHQTRGIHQQAQVAIDARDSRRPAYLLWRYLALALERPAVCGQRLGARRG